MRRPPSRWTVHAARFAIVLLTVASSSAWLAGCRSEARVGQKRTIYHKLGSWSGHTNVQTESWPGDTGAMRITWNTTHATADGTFQLTIHSAISGRAMQVVVDHDGDGAGTAYFSDDPRIFFAVVDAKNLDWTFTIEEPVDVIVTPK